MYTINHPRIKAYRDFTYNLLPGRRLAASGEALRYVNERGFIFFWPIKGLELPSLWVATAGNRPVPNEHDDPGHVCWQWKDEMLDKQVWYYSRLVHKKNTIVSLDTAPNFYSLSPNYGDPYSDYQQQYEQGLLTLEAKRIYELLINNGSMHTIAIRKALGYSTKLADSRFDRALNTLQIEMKIMPVGIAKAGAWRYAFIYDLVARHYPDIPNKAKNISEACARGCILEIYLKSVGLTNFANIQRLFNWRSSEVQKTVDLLVIERKAVVINSDQKDQPEKNLTILLPELL